MQRLINDMENIRVSVICTTYNHSRYIGRCLDGFLLQKTKFKFQVIIHDDASTDNTQQIINDYVSKYPDLFIPILQKENLYSKGEKRYPYILPHLHGDYVAFCEGDDYWCDENKLQMQFEALENHSNCSICVHTVRFISENGCLIKKTYPNKTKKNGTIKSIDFIEMVCKNHSFQLSSFFVRKADYLSFVTNPPRFVQISDVGDEPMRLFFGSIGDAYYIDREMSKYRQFSLNSWTSKIKKTSKEKLKKHIYNTINMINSFDEYTEYKYHVYCYNKVQMENLGISYIDCDFHKFLSKPGFLFFISSSMKTRIKIILGIFFPFAFKKNSNSR